MNIISVKQLRENFGALKAELEQGESFLLMYRSQPLAELKPVKQKASGKVSDKERIKRNLRTFKRLAGGIRLGKWAKEVTPERINELLDERYEKVLP